MKKILNWFWYKKPQEEVIEKSFYNVITREKINYEIPDKTPLERMIEMGLGDKIKEGDEMNYAFHILLDEIESLIGLKNCYLHNEKRILDLLDPESPLYFNNKISQKYIFDFIEKWKRNNKKADKNYEKENIPKTN